MIVHAVATDAVKVICDSTESEHALSGTATAWLNCESRQDLTVTAFSISDRRDNDAELKTHHCTLIAD
jgi:hypothetical protein